MDSYSPSSSAYHYKEEKSRKRSPAPTAKIPTKDRITKKPIAPWPRTPPKVYNVAPVDFRDVVQKLTGPPEPAARLQHEWFPPVLAEHTVDAVSYSVEEEQQQTSISFGELMSPLALSVSTPSLAWSAYHDLLSP